MIRWFKFSGVYLLLLCFLAVLSACDSSTGVADRSTTSSPVLVSEPDHANIVSVAATNDVVYLAESDGSLTARKASNGQVIWHRTGLALLPKPYSFVWLVPAAQVLYDAYDPTVTTARVEARQISTGQVVWSQEIPRSLGPGYVAIAADAGMIYVNTVAPSDRGMLYALRASDSEIRWQYAFSGQPMDTSVYIASGLVAIRDRPSSVTIHVFHGADGSPLLSYSCPAGENWHPATDSSHIYVYCSGLSLKAYRITDGKLAWTASNLLVHYLEENKGMLYVNAGTLLQAIRAQDGTVIWQSTLPQGFDGPSAFNQLIAVITQDQNVTAFHANNGTLAWKRPLGSTSTYTDLDADGFFLFGNTQTIDVWNGSNGKDILHTTTASRIVWQPQVVNARLYLWEYDGTLEVVDLHSGNVLWRYIL